VPAKNFNNISHYAPIMLYYEIIFTLSLSACFVSTLQATAACWLGRAVNVKCRKHNLLQGIAIIILLLLRIASENKNYFFN